MERPRLKRLKDVEKAVVRDTRSEILHRENFKKVEKSASKTSKQAAKALAAALVTGLRQKAKDMEWGSSDSERMIGEICGIIAEIVETEIRSMK